MPSTRFVQQSDLCKACFVTLAQIESKAEGRHEYILDLYRAKVLRKETKENFRFSLFLLNTLSIFLTPPICSIAWYGDVLLRQLYVLSYMRELCWAATPSLALRISQTNSNCAQLIANFYSLTGKLDLDWNGIKVHEKKRRSTTAKSTSRDKDTENKH